jgi:ribosomal protein S18 acetylase RimI-like enzyme
MELSIHQAGPADVNEIVSLVQSVYRGESSRQGWTTEADLLDGQRTDPAMIQELMDEPGSVFLLARQNGKLMASVLLQRKADHAYLGMLSVAVLAQNLKLGRRMMDESALYIKKNWRLNEIRITVIGVRRELIGWYERRGFKATGNVFDFPADPRFGIPKVPRLDFIEMAKPV